MKNWQVIKIFAFRASGQIFLPFLPFLSLPTLPTSFSSSLFFTFLLRNSSNFKPWTLDWIWGRTSICFSFNLFYYCRPMEETLFKNCIETMILNLTLTLEWLLEVVLWFPRATSAAPLNHFVWLLHFSMFCLLSLDQYLFSFG